MKTHKTQVPKIDSPSGLSLYVSRWLDGDATALSDLFEVYYQPRIYPLACRLLRTEGRLNKTLEPEALVGHLFEKVQRFPPREFMGEPQFWKWMEFSARQILTSMGRKLKTQSRSGISGTIQHIYISQKDLD